MWGWHLPSFDLSILSFGPSTASPVIVADLFFFVFILDEFLGTGASENIKFNAQISGVIYFDPHPPQKTKVSIAACALPCHCAGLERPI